MKWLEVITLRSTALELGSIEARVLAWVAEASGCEEKMEIEVYRRAGLDTDLSVHIHHESSSDEVRSSMFGVSLAEAMSELSLTTSSVWVESSRGT